MWSDDSSNSLIVANPSRGYNQKITPCADGGFFISWINPDDGYSLYLQRLDSTGILQLPSSSPSTEGILVYQRNENSSTNYGSAIDIDGNIVFGIDSGALDSNPGGNAIACKVSHEGELLFSLEGIIISPEVEIFNGDVHCAATNDGGVVFGWNVGEATSIQLTKISADGSIIWNASIPNPSSQLQISINALNPSDNGSVIVSFFVNDKPQGSSYNSPGDLLTQKLNGSDGSYQWAESVYIYERQGTETGAGPRNAAVSTDDGKGNVFFATPAQDSESDAIYVQGVTYAGVKTFEENGPVVSTNVDAHKTIPAIGFNSSSIYVVWNSRESREYVEGDHSAAFMQRIDITGQRLWGDNGLQLDDYLVNNSGSIPIAVIPSVNDILAIWVAAYPSDGQVNNISASLLDEAGLYIWDNQTMNMKTNATSANSPAAAKSTGNDFTVASWIDDETPVRAQNINLDGSLG